MLTNTTLNLPDDLIARAQSYAAAHGTTLNAIIVQHLEAVTATSNNPITDKPLQAYSQGRLARSEAIRLLGVRDYAGLLVLLGDADLPMPVPPASEIEAQAIMFEHLWAGP